MLEINNNYTVQDLKTACVQNDSKKVYSIYSKIAHTENEFDLLKEMFFFTFRKDINPAIYQLFLRKYIEKSINKSDTEKDILINHIFQHKDILKQLNNIQSRDIFDSLKKIATNENKKKISNIKKELEKIINTVNHSTEKASNKQDKVTVPKKEELSEKAKKQLANKDIEIKQKTKKLEDQEKEISILKQKISNLNNDINLKNAKISNLTHELKKQENVNLNNIEEFQRKEADLNKIIQQREEDIKVLLIQKDDKKANFINTLENKLKIRFKDFTTFRNIEDSETKAMSMEITLEKVFEILKNEGINL